MIMKKLLSAALSLALLGALALPAWAAGEEPPILIAPAPQADSQAASQTGGLDVQVNGEKLELKAHVTVPLRAVAEAMGCTVTWKDGLITVVGPERYIELTVGADQYFAAPTQEGMLGASLFSLGCAPYAVGGVTYVPVELFDALLGCKEGTVTVEQGTVKISTAPEEAAPARSVK